MGVTRFARSSGRSNAGVAIRHHMPGNNDGLDFQAICGPQKEPTSEKSLWIENHSLLKNLHACKVLIIKDMVEAAGVELITTLRTRKLLIL